MGIKIIGEHIFDFVARFRNLIQIENNNSLTTTSNKTIILVDSNKSGVTGDGIANITTAVKLDLDDTATNHSGALVTQQGIDIDIDSSNAQGSITNAGIDIDVTGADNNIGIDITVPASDATNNNHLIFRSSADSGDKFTIYTDTHGATTITTVDDDAAAAHLSFAIDGDIKFGGANTVGGWHGDADMIKILPGDFLGNEDVPTGVVQFDDTGTVGVSATNANTELNCFVPIPFGKKATHVDIFASSALTITAFEADLTDGSVTTKGTGAANTTLDITDINHADDTYFGVRVVTTATTDIVFGGKVTIADI